MNYRVEEYYSRFNIGQLSDCEYNILPTPTLSNILIKILSIIELEGLWLLAIGHWLFRGIRFVDLYIVGFADTSIRLTANGQ